MGTSVSNEKSLFWVCSALAVCIKTFPLGSLLFDNYSCKAFGLIKLAITELSSVICDPKMTMSEPNVQPLHSLLFFACLNERILDDLYQQVSRYPSMYIKSL